MNGKWIVAALVAGSGVIAIAQTPPPSGSSSTQPGTSAQPGNVTVTGCVARAPGGAGAAGAGAERYILTSATVGSGTTTGTTGTTGRGAAGASGSMGSTYQLEGSSSDLQSNVGKRVEVVGRLSPASGRAGGGATGTTGAGATGGAGAGTTGSTGASGAAMPAGQIQVTSVKMIAESCTASPAGATSPAGGGATPPGGTTR